jgi:acetoin utilization deacetylase AcuC-like enzyme
MATGWVCHELYFWHDPGSAAAFVPAGHGIVEPEPHADSAATKRRFRNLVDVSGLLDQLVSMPPRPASEEQLLRVHSPEYLARLQELSADRGGETGIGTPIGPGGYEIAALAAGGTITAVDAVLDGTVSNAYALVRPCGHHAQRDHGMGFCVLGNAAIAAAHARQTRQLDRVAIVDWDVHHGNGTQAAFYDNPTVVTISVHQDDCYPPGSGGLDEAGDGAGQGFNLNVPLPPGSGVGAYVAAFERVVAPALLAFRPQLVIVASGLDANVLDPLARMMMTSDGYRTLTRIVMDVTREICGGRLVLTHEGGYSSAYVPFCGLAIVEELSGIRTAIVDPIMPAYAGAGGQALQPHQDDAVRTAETLLVGLS